MTKSPSRPTVIPYITAREGENGERASKLGVRWNSQGLCYVDERPVDRDERGVLWARLTQSLRDGMPWGKPRWRQVHPSRQRETMMYLKCQVCAQPASRTDQGYLFLHTRPAPGTVERGWPEKSLTAHPPLCLEHAVVASRQCAHLTDAGYVALRAKRPRLYGVFGTAYTTDALGRATPLPATREPLPYGHPFAHWYLASQMVRQLHDVCVVDLETELAVAEDIKSHGPLFEEPSGQ
ncbi:hypothetical protein [Streptomyces litchfieldiae]|uniref:Uncharacterized protein n=1 Tax=Streptomyces litchfieldiae TaxID=3075543 RepID=A0ABU2MR61_9ACTN|nr:hypothetical protein [Streptomyces sp. DSM 44938]MDT0344122.1 hypothetical protein [Streptomyces sp. DSM 44938]